MNKKVHDSFCRGVLSHVPTFLELVHYLTTIDDELKIVVDLLDENTFVRIPGDYSDTANTGYADLAFLAKLKNSIGSAVQLSVGFLLEHKSYPDDGVMMQLRKYNYHLMFEHMAENADKGIPSIAIILYNGKESWDPLTKEISAYPKELQKFLLPFKGMMLDVSNISDDVVKTFNARFAALVCSLKYARDPQGNRVIFSSIVDRINAELSRDEALDLLRQMNVYLDGWVSENFMEAFEMDFIRPNYRTIGDARFDEGVERQAVETARKMLAGKEPMEKIISYSGLSEERIRALQAEQ